jgi:hypothetical protein
MPDQYNLVKVKGHGIQQGGDETEVYGFYIVCQLFESIEKVIELLRGAQIIP